MALTPGLVNKDKKRICDVAVTLQYRPRAVNDNSSRTWILQFLRSCCMHTPSPYPLTDWIGSSLLELCFVKEHRNEQNTVKNLWVALSQQRFPAKKWTFNKNYMTLEEEIWQKNPYVLEITHYWNTPLELKIINITI